MALFSQEFLFSLYKAEVHDEYLTFKIFIFNIKYEAVTYFSIIKMFYWIVNILSNKVTFFEYIIFKIILHILIKITKKQVKHFFNYDEKNGNNC